MTTPAATPRAKKTSNKVWVYRHRKSTEPLFLKDFHDQSYILLAKRRVDSMSFGRDLRDAARISGLVATDLPNRIVETFSAVRTGKQNGSGHRQGNSKWRPDW